ncbi:MAG: hypothetical protein ACREYE_09270 [Gammaproteobacteria bacterium]
MKNKLLFLFPLLVAIPALAVMPEEDVATTITLRGHQCGGPATNVQERQDAEGNKTVVVLCPNGSRYRIDVTKDGRLTVTPIR